MLNKSVARRYAEAFFGLALEANSLDQFQQELETIVATIEEVPDLKGYLGHLLVPAKDKKEIIKKIFAGQVSPLTLNFLQVIVDKRREGYLAAIVEEFKAMADETRNITKAELFSAKAIADEEVQDLAGRLSASTGKTVKLNQVVDESLLGGVKLRIGDRIIDATIAKKLELLKEQLKKAKIS